MDRILVVADNFLFRWFHSIMLDVCNIPLLQILMDLESLVDNMPKIKRSNSEPSSLHYSHIPLADSFSNSPHIPVHNKGPLSETFQFNSEA